MGAYISQDELASALSQDELVQLTDDAGTGQADTAVVDQVIAEAEAEVDAYLAARYTLPLTTVPAVVKRIAVDLAVWALYTRRKLTDEAVNARHKQAQRLLEAMARGTVSLGLPAATAPAESGPTGTKTADDRVFTAETLRGFTR